MIKRQKISKISLLSDDEIIETSKSIILSQSTENQIVIDRLTVLILDLKGNTVANKGELTLFDNTQINYSDKTIINYMNESVDVISLVEVNRDLIKEGVYTVNIFIENKFAGASQITLK